MSARTRYLTVAAVTVISLACGTNYVYSAWGPQFAQRLDLSATQSNIISTCANLGSYFTGIPFGLMVDRYGPRFGIGLGVIFFSLGYYPLARAYVAGPGQNSLFILCTYSFFTGAGSNAAFLGALKAAALSFPHSRGTATAFPLAAYGLSAFFFATLALALPHDPEHFLLMLAAGTVLLPIISFPFVRAATPTYRAVPLHDSQVLHRTVSPVDPRQIRRPETGAQTTNLDPKLSHSTTTFNTHLPQAYDGSDEQSSLLSSPASSDMEDLEDQQSIGKESEAEHARIDAKGFILLCYPEFWQLFTMLGLLTGIGLMTINNIGNDARTLWRHFDSSKDPAFVAKRQVMHVSIISLCSFCGRLLSGIGSDVLVNKYGRSRFWCLFISASGFTVAQTFGVLINNPNYLFLLSGVTGVSYGMLFGVFPSLVAYTFGIQGLSQNYGAMCLAPVISGNVFNLLYGKILDSNSSSEGERDCMKGKYCYQPAYVVTLVSAMIGILICLWSIHHEQMALSKSEKRHERIA